MSVFKDKQRTKDGRQWRFKVYYHNSEGKLVPYTSKRYLLQKEAKAEERIFILNRDRPVKKQFDIIADEYFNNLVVRVKESSFLEYLGKYNKNIKPYFGNKFIDDIGVCDIENWKKLISKKLKINSCNENYVVFKEIFRFANRKYELNYNPVEISGRFKEKNDKIVSDSEKIRYITYEEFCKFISVINDNMWKAFFITLYMTGMRKGEISALTWKDIDFEKRTIRINKSASFRCTTGKYKITNTKTSNNRQISMSKVLLNELSEYKKKVQKYNDYNDDWFVFGNGKILTNHYINKYRHKYFELSGIHEITTHEFRHSHVSVCINEYLKSGESDPTKFFLMMSQRMGHSLDVMIKTYTHLFPTVQTKIVDLLDNLQ